MSNYTGNDGVVKIGAAAIGELKGFNIEESATVHDNTVINGENTRTVKGGRTQWNGGIEVHYDPDDTAIATMVVGAEVAFEGYPTGEASGMYKLDGNILINSASTPIEVDGMIVQSYSFDGSGDLGKTAQP